MKIGGARRVKLNKLHTECPQTLGATVQTLGTTVQNLVAETTRRPRFVRPWLGV